MSEYCIEFADSLDRPPETMVGETVYDSEGNAVGWIVNANVGVGTCHRVKWKYEGFKYCSECGGMLANWVERSGEYPCYCPNCGRRIIKEETE